ncbi:MAG: hypothetical protein WBV23_12685 [Desulfobaccales bacterium]
MIKKLSMMVAALGVLAFLTAPPSGAQQQAPPAAVPGQPAARQAARLYNPQTVEILAGRVVAINRLAPKKAGRPVRVTMVLQTDQGAVKVHLGPADFIDQQMILAVGDQVEVKGVRITRPRVTMFIAGEVKKGDQVLKLRDDATGRPLWFKGKNPGGAM